jgi:hypothetical protein
MIKRFTQGEADAAETSAAVMEPTLDDWRVLEATNQTTFREMNEWTEETGRDAAGSGWTPTCANAATRPAPPTTFASATSDLTPRLMGLCI